MAARIDVNRCHRGAWAVAVRAAGLAGIAALSAACGFQGQTYSAEAIDSRVVDANTGEPVPGGNVVAEWVLKGGVESGQVTGYANVMETVTDKDGRFHFPAWGPVSVKSGTVREAGPALLLFKPGYRYVAYANGSSAEAPSHMTSRWSNRDLKVQRTSGAVEAMANDMTTAHVQVENFAIHHQIVNTNAFACEIGKEGDRIKVREPRFLGITSADLRSYGAVCWKE